MLEWSDKVEERDRVIEEKLERRGTEIKDRNIEGLRREYSRDSLLKCITD